METIDELIYSEFSKVEYSVIGRIANAPIFVNNDNSDFWLIMEDYDIDVEFQKSLADNYEGIMDGYIAAAKNTSVLVLKKLSILMMQIRIGLLKWKTINSILRSMFYSILILLGIC